MRAIRHGLAVLLLVPVLLLLSAASPAQRTYEFDTAGSSASARVGFLGIGSRTARFPTMSGLVTIDPQQIEAINLDVTLDARKLQAPDNVTLKRLRGEKFFWVERYPSVRFTGQRMIMRSALSGTVEGQLTARGVTRPMRLDVTFDRNPETATPGATINLTGTGSIDRRDFGMTAYSMVVGKTVTIRLKAALKPRG